MSLLVVLAAAIAVPTDDQICQSFTRQYATMTGSKMGPLIMLKSGPDCRTRTVTNNLAVSLAPDQRESYLTIFMQAANAGVCQSTDPAVRHIKSLGWRMLYNFKFPDGSVVHRKLDC